MPDQLDQAQEFEQQRRDDLLAQQSRKPVMTFTGQCYNCDAVIEWGCFCDPDCREDYELRKKQQKQRV